VRQLLLDALRHWVTEYQVDGFCFVNAENLTQVRSVALRLALDARQAGEERAAACRVSLSLRAGCATHAHTQPLTTAFACVACWARCCCCRSKLQDTFGGVMDSPAIVEEIVSDAVLTSCKLIAASANDSLLPRSGVRGFPHYGVLLEWNNRFGADMLSLLRDNAREWLGHPLVSGGAGVSAPSVSAACAPPGLPSGHRPAHPHT
jgi:hypothetical protein